DRVLLEVAPGMLDAPPQIGAGLQVKHPVAAVDRLFERGGVEHVALDEPHSGPTQRVGEILPAPGPEVVDDHDLEAVSDQPVGQVASDETGTAGDAGPGACAGGWTTGPPRSGAGCHRYSVKPAATASPWNILTVSSEYCSRFLPRQSSFLSRSWVTVMMWHPTWSACTRFRISRGEAQISSERGACTMMSTERAMIGTGSTPASAMRPANTDM